MSMRSVVVALLAGALCAWAGEAARPCATDPGAADDGSCVAAEGSSMIQSRSTAGVRKGGKTCKNLGVFLDGSYMELGYKCDFGDYKTTATCESQIAALWRLAGEVSQAEQLIHYEPGVASLVSPNDDGNFGIGTKQHMLNTYKWLAQNYESCGNKIYMFGYSRGALSARMLQGMIHNVGLAKPGYVNQAAQKNFQKSCDSACMAAFKSSTNVWPNVQIEFLGLFESVLRTLLHPTQHCDIASFHMQLTSTVLKFRHALSLGEHRELFEAAELYVDPATDATQVWFFGEHADIGGGWPSTGVAQIPSGWMADQAVAAGFLLPTDWKGRSSMAVNYMGDVFTERGLGPAGTVLGIHLDMTLGLALVRNPVRCRNHSGHPFKDQPVLVHQSVSDRMAGNPGWVPLPSCCPDASLFESSIQYVTNDHYEQSKAASSGGAPWLKLTFGWLRDTHPHESDSDWHAWDTPEYYVKATSWTDEVPLPDGGITDYEGCCTVVYQYPAGSSETYNIGTWWSTNYKAKVHFNRYLVLPNESTTASKINVEVHEDDIVGDDFVGRVEIQLSDLNIGQMKAYPLSKGGTLEIKVESIASDNAAKNLLPGSGPAQCRWLLQQTGMDLSTVCNPSLALWGAAGSLNLGSAQNCDGFVQDIKTGAF